MFQMQRKPYLAGFFGVSNGRGNLSWCSNALICNDLLVVRFWLEYHLEYQIRQRSNRLLY